MAEVREGIADYCDFYNERLKQTLDYRMPRRVFEEAKPLKIFSKVPRCERVNYSGHEAESRGRRNSIPEQWSLRSHSSCALRDTLNDIDDGNSSAQFDG